MRHPSSVAHILLLVIGSGLAGAFVASVPWRTSLLLIVLAGTAATLVLARVALQTAVPHLPTMQFTGAFEEEDQRYRAPRYVFYVGAATIGLLTVRPALAFTLSDWIFFACVGLTAVALLASGVDRDYLIPRTVTVGMGLFAAGGFVSSFGAVAPAQSISIIARLLYLTIVWFWLATTLLQTRAHVRTAALAWIVSAALSASGTLVQLVYGNVIPGGDSAWGRMTGFTPHYNHLGGLVAIAFVPALMLAVDSIDRRSRTVGLVCVPLLATGLLLSGSVGGMLSTTCALVFWLAVRGVSMRTAARLAGVVAAAAVVLVATGASNVTDPVQRVKRVTSAEEAAAGTGGTLYTRLEGFEEAWSRIQEQPFVGVGLDEVSSQKVLGPKLVHNMLINQWFSGGILALVGIVLVLAGVALTGAHVVRRSVGEERGFSSALLASVIAFVVFGMGEPILFVRYGWFPAALLLALYAQDRRRDSSAPTLSAPTNA